MIGVFDSGIGGVTVLRELLKILPNENYLYYSDSIHCPYGDKSKEELESYTSYIVEYLINKGCKIIVIACNTASAICKQYLREKYDVPIVAIEPACKMVYDLEDNSKTIIMATSGTVNSRKFIELYQKYDNNNMVICNCQGLAELIEKGDKEKIISYLTNKFENYINIENVILGCTHYPLIKNEIKSVLGNVNFFDGSIGVSKQVKRILQNKKMLSNNSGKVTFIDSSNNKDKEKLFFSIATSDYI